MNSLIAQERFTLTQLAQRLNFSPADLQKRIDAKIIDATIRQHQEPIISYDEAFIFCNRQGRGAWRIQK